jgi:hypothetical protein
MDRPRAAVWLDFRACLAIHSSCERTGVQSTRHLHRVAIEYENRVLALQPADEPEWDQAIDAHLGLAEAHVGLGERERARTHALLARDGFAKIGGRREDERREAEAILAGLDPSN